MRPEEFKPWRPSHYAVVMNGLDFYSNQAVAWKPLRSNPWDVRGIKNGLVFERVSGDHERMVYFGIDLDRNRVYHHYENGGFPDDPYGPVDKGIKQRTEPARHGAPHSVHEEATRIGK